MERPPSISPKTADAGMKTFLNETVAWSVGILKVLRIF
jgi:hypothetical protein